MVEAVMVVAEVAVHSGSLGGKTIRRIATAMVKRQNDRSGSGK